jgi:hypothetical protein
MPCLLLNSQPDPYCRGCERVTSLQSSARIPVFAEYWVWAAALKSALTCKIAKIDRSVAWCLGFAYSSGISCSFYKSSVRGSAHACCDKMHRFQVYCILVCRTRCVYIYPDGKVSRQSCGTCCIEARSGKDPTQHRITGSHSLLDCIWKGPAGAESRACGARRYILWSHVSPS